MKSKQKVESYNLDAVEQVVEEAFVKEPEEETKKKSLRKSISEQ